MPSAMRKGPFREWCLLESRIKVFAPLTEEAARNLACGQQVRLSGSVLLARDAAHARMALEMEEGLALPFDPKGAVLFYAGPTPAPPGRVIGAIGPTTSARMDPYTPLLLKAGVRGMIGKGKRSVEVVAAMMETGAVYFGATGGAAALLASSVKAVSPLAYADLGPEAILLLQVSDLPLVVAIDSMGNDLFEQGQKKYCIGTDQVILRKL